MMSLFFFICFSWKEMWLQDYWQSLDQGEALTAMIHHNESHQGRFWDYMQEIFLKRTRQHWSIPWFGNCIESCDWEFLLLSRYLPSNRRNSCRLFFWCMKWVILCCDFSCGDVSNWILYLNFSSVVWSSSWHAGGAEEEFCIWYCFPVASLISKECISDSAQMP